MVEDLRERGIAKGSVVSTFDVAVVIRDSEEVVDRGGLVTDSTRHELRKVQLRGEGNCSVVLSPGRVLK